MLRRLVFPLGRPYVVPSDHLGHQVAQLLIEPSATRDRLTSGMYLPRVETDVIGAIELALEATLAAEPVEAKIRDAVKGGAHCRENRRGPSRCCAGSGRHQRRRVGACAPARRLADADHPRRRFCAGLGCVRTCGHRPWREAPRRSRTRPRPERRACSRSPRRAAAAMHPYFRRGSHERAGLRCRRYTNAIPEGAQPSRAVCRVRSRDPGGARAAQAHAVCAGRTRRSDPRLRQSVAGRGQHRPRRRVASRLRPQGARLDGDAQLRVGDAGARFRADQHSCRTLEPRARGRHRRLVARAAALFRQDGAVVRQTSARRERWAKRRRHSCN